MLARALKLTQQKGSNAFIVITIELIEYVLASSNVIIQCNWYYVFQRQLNLALLANVITSEFDLIEEMFYSLLLIFKFIMHTIIQKVSNPK